MAFARTPGPAARRRRRLGLATLLVAAGLLCGSCAPRKDPQLGDIGISCPLSRFVELGVKVERVLVRFEPAESGDYTELDLAIEGNAATGVIALTPGTWYLAAELYGEGETLVATGEAAAAVLPGAVTQVRLRVSLLNGGIDVEVEWDDRPALYVADISHRPVEVQIGGIGTFAVSGLSRVGWDIQVIEIATGGGRTHKEPGAVTYPDVAMLGLRSSAEEIALLAEWTEDPTPRTLVLRLDGLAAERYRFRLTDTVPVAANRQTFDVEDSEELEMGGIRLSISAIEIYESVPAFRVGGWPPAPRPGQRVQIEMVDADLAYAAGVLDVPDAGTSDPLFLPSARRGDIVHMWAALVLGTIGSTEGIFRTNLAVVDVDEDNVELGRRLFYSAWPASINLFNPEKPYGEDYLIDVLVVCDRVEEG